MTYYSMYYSTLSLFFKIGLKCENHAAAIVLLKRVFGIDNSKLSFAKKERLDKQYYIDFHLTKQDAVKLIEVAENYNAEIMDFIDRLDNDRIKNYRIKLRGIFVKK